MRLPFFPKARLACAAVALAAFAPAPPARAQAPDPFAILDVRFRAEEARARRETATKSGPVIVVHEGDRVVLLRGRDRSEATFVPPTDSVLRTVARVPLALHAALATAGEDELDPVRHTELSQFQKLISDAQRALVGRGFAQASLDRQQLILSESAHLLERVIEKRRVDSNRLADFARAMAPLVTASFDEAARAQIDGLHTVVTRWKRKIPDAEWASLRVVIAGRHMHREGELATQYFMRLLGETGEGRRVVYAEGVEGEAAALDILGTHLLEYSRGAAFFGPERKAHRDVLADAARAYLEVLRPEAPPPPPPAAPSPETGDKKKKKKKSRKEDRPSSQTSTVQSTTDQ